ncbi:phenylacetone monooxygenase [Colletotrichum truncatum]|uniref:Phenylacetone monooxygenase n=1 Tax=Colletotrichum truncatum TaxID=5467 RepID=A0ACC3YRV3_COLTU|nr:phenylacetone monooxygenase [Colletotrichum truncatum]KAF6789952.1 phenylacetone monooxygenase [Colletotrichum truncatum]
MVREQLQHQNIEAYWKSKNSGYDVLVNDKEKGSIIINHGGIFINDGGILDNWKWPAISGLGKFEGVLLHIKVTERGLAGLPIYFLMLSPTCPISNNLILPVIESQAEWILNVVNRCHTNSMVEMSWKPLRMAR